MQQEGRLRQGARPMLLCDPEGAVVDVNRAACLLLRLGREEAKGLGLDDLVLAPGRRLLDAAIERARARAATGQVQGQGERQGPTPEDRPGEGRVAEDDDGATVATITLAMPDGPRLLADVHVASGGPRPLDLLTLTFPSTHGEAQAGALLTEREREVLTQVALGRTGQLIATDLFLAPATVESHVSRALHKLGAGNRPHGVALALRAGEIDPGAFVEPRDRPVRPPVLRPGPVDLRQVSIDALDDPVAVLDETGEVSAVNATWRRLAAGRGPQEPAGATPQRLRALYHGGLGAADGAAELQWGIQEILLGNSTSILVEYALESPTGVRWLEARATRHVDGPPMRVLVHLHDLTREHAARQVTVVGRSLLDELDVAMVRTTLDGVVTSWRAGAEDLYGYTEAEAVGRHLTDVVREADGGDAVAESLRRVLVVGRWAGRERIRRRDDQPIEVHVRKALLRDGQGRPDGIVSVAVDISAEAHASRVLRSTRERLRVVCDAMEEGVVTVDPAGIVEDVNPAGARILGWEDAELRGKRVQDAIYAPDGAGTAFAVQHAGRGLRVDADRFVRHDGSMLAVSYVSAPFDAGEAASGTVIVFRDVAEDERQRATPGPQPTDARMLRVLREALDDERLVLHAEPVVELRGGGLVRHELVPRVADGGGLLALSRFLPAAREDGLVRRIDGWMLEQAARLAAEGHHVEVGLSAESVADPTAVDVVRSALERAGADPTLVALGVPPSALRVDPQQAVAFVRRVADLGCAPVLDDFGSGDVGLHDVRDLPWHAIKLDTGAVAPLRDEDGGRSIVRAFVELAAGFRLRTVARRVEDDETRAALVELGVEQGQGDVLGRVAEADAALRAAVRDR